jgi:hypothetical protein
VIGFDHARERGVGQPDERVIVDAHRLV